MTRETAVTESINYGVEECLFCGSEVGLGNNIPEDELVKPGLAVLVGGGEVSISEERKGNWDVEVEFAGNQSDRSPPAVTGHVLCYDCAESVHNYSRNNEFYRGPLPDELTGGTGGLELPISNRALVAIIGLVLLLVILLMI
ncbi:hypothetical protein PN419_13800 [Halorubrum ezzemoulense]|uniref:hypothetical protein n=1 Tax=Halorubrum ezzemoulense TaxID=337243 RepID=UPI00232C2E34|nr:hypothetical protein [Halorubrum ezzemoulense]MDB9250058.1 hypothetical protein [Halorubrum ezzemoulense]MDB9260083.1 hypothetical protein [Halorubrum ezzemoulense]MDB9264385.1 hypothetical protein [Halorubrum ezzemoulense]MDB9267103.1 hypothetical protein [Halorubrum ezzemoulense]MDB9270444.1 hypothetical protein [Halorubrum ezzemoulense]